MKQEMLKKIMVLTLAVLVALVGMPLNAFADLLTVEEDLVLIYKDRGKVNVEFFEPDQSFAYIPTYQEGESNKSSDVRMAYWTKSVNEESHPFLISHAASAIKLSTISNQDTALPFSGSYGDSINGSAFYNSGDSDDDLVDETTATAQKITGLFEVYRGETITLIVYSDDGIDAKFTSLTQEDTVVAADSWILSTNNKISLVLSEGIYDYELRYMNWGGQGKLYPEISGESAEVTSNRFFLEGASETFSAPSIVSVDYDAATQSMDKSDNRYSFTAPFYTPMIDVDIYCSNSALYETISIADDEITKVLSEEVDKLNVYKANGEILLFDNANSNYQRTLSSTYTFVMTNRAFELKPLEGKTELLKTINMPINTEMYFTEAFEEFHGDVVILDLDIKYELAKLNEFDPLINGITIDEDTGVLTIEPGMNTTTSFKVEATCDDKMVHTTVTVTVTDKEMYNVTYYSVLETTFDTVPVTQGDDVTKIVSVPSNLGYKFEYWDDLDKEGEENFFSTDTKAANDYNLIAIWSLDPSVHISNAGSNEYGETIYADDATVTIQSGYSGITILPGNFDLDYVLAPYIQYNSENELIKELLAEMNMRQDSMISNVETIKLNKSWTSNNTSVLTINETTGAIAANDVDGYADVTLSVSIEIIFADENDIETTKESIISPPMTDVIRVNVNHTPRTTTPDPDPKPRPNPSPSFTQATPISVSIDPDVYTLEYGTAAEEKEVQFEATVSGTGSKDVRWSISSNEFLEIDQEGNVTFKAEPSGLQESFSATVTVRTVVGGATDTARVLIEENSPLGAIEFFDPYISGYPDQSFRPQNSVTRAEVATMFARILKLNTSYPGNQSFNDVTSDQWYYNYVQAIARTDIFIGESNGNFRPNDAITRAEMATAFAKFWAFLDITVDSSAVQITDMAGEHWAKEYVYMMYNAGIVSGFPDGTYKPNDPTLREQVVGMINTLISRPENNAIASKFNDIKNTHWAFGNIEAASQVFINQQNIPVQE